MSAIPVEAGITPGIYDRIPEAKYHADRSSLSVSGAKRLLPPSCPAKFKWEQDNGQGHKRVFDFGHAAHAKVLGTGLDVEIVQTTAKDGTKSDAAGYTTNAAKAHRDEIYAAGKVPLLAEELERVNGMAVALAEHPVASALLDPNHGEPEQSMYLPDDKTGVLLRGRLDWLPNPSTDGHLVIPDYKTSFSAEPGAFSRSAATFGYHLQASWYSDMVIGLGLAKRVTFLFIVQAKTAPYLVSVIELDDEALITGRERNREAIDLYADCVKNDRWPGYTDASPELVSLPFWATSDLEMDVI